ncbi:hypothetical protein [Embleya hyalina]|uniref:Uncharacterized protein n=1 Tax=Embleya hyalina TaxID=516124 RepID=A0A401YJG7_9ACTN|nr:hypothetical protein [Embleya hyalina]GCD94727.1 hypothetical protein EHYA_02396 [Embleya hyalina]
MRSARRPRPGSTTTPSPSASRAEPDARADRSTEAGVTGSRVSPTPEMGFTRPASRDPNDIRPQTYVA